ncbi:MAG TPA: hypothetical protein VIC85_14525 [Ktedonobacterales bacterium]|jgi:hypothetical protein
MHYKLPELEEKGFAVLRKYDGPPVADSEWSGLEYVDWKSGGDTNFAPIASAFGAMECHGFWDHGKPDKDGLWTDNAKVCPTLVKWVENVGARYGRVRIIKLNPSVSPEAALRNTHLDDNNRLNPDGEGWVVRAWLQLTDNPDSYMIVRDKQDDPSTESRIYLPKYSQFVVDSERLYHAVYHPGSAPRYALITSFESGPALEAWMKSQAPVPAGAPAQ